MQPPDVQVLRDSRDGVLLKRTALSVLRTPQPGDVDLIRRLICNQGFLTRLDAPDTYKSTILKLRLTKIVRALGDSRSAESQRALVALTGDGVFLSEPLRVKLLILGLSKLDPMQPAALDFWRKHAQPGSSLATDVALATMTNRSIGALQIFGQMIGTEAHPQGLRSSWLRRFLLPVRDDYPVVQLSEWMLRTIPSPQMQTRILETLFQFDPDVWYKSCRHPRPPIRALASDRSKVALHAIAVQALANAGRYPADLRGALEGARQELEPRGGGAPPAQA